MWLMLKSLSFDNSFVFEQIIIYKMPWEDGDIYLPYRYDWYTAWLK